MFDFVKRSLGGHDFHQVAGTVTNIQHGEHREEKSAGFGVEVVTIECNTSRKAVALARFTDDDGYGNVAKGDVVSAKYSNVLDPEHFGTESKMMDVKVRRFALDL